MTIDLGNILSTYSSGEPYVSAAVVAKHLNLNIWTIYKLAERGKIRSHKFGKSLRFKISEL
jgi:excisionase family DNA binding protein